MLQTNLENTPFVTRNFPIEKNTDQGSSLAPKSKLIKGENTGIISDYGIYGFTLISSTGMFENNLGRLNLPSAQPLWLVVNRSPINEVEQNSQITDNHINAVNLDRIRLLARKYATKLFPKEDEARLLILQEKIRNLFPRVTDKDYDKLDEIIDKVKFIEEKDQELRKKLTNLD